MRFNISSDLVARLAQMSKAEMSADPVALIEGLNRFIEKSVGADVLEKARYTFTKQIENFDDALALATKNVFESARVYPIITQAALAFQTSFATISSNPQIISGLSMLFRPVVDQLQRVVADFVGVTPGMLQTLPMGQLEQVIEANFANLTPEQYQTQLKNFVSGLIDTFSLFREQAQTVLAPIREFAYSIFSDIGKAGAEILGQSAMAVIKGFISNPISALQFGATFGMALLPVMAGFRAVSAVFDRAIRFRLSQEAIQDVIARRQYELGIRKDPILELQKRQEEVVRMYNRRLGLESTPQPSQFLPPTFIQAVNNNTQAAQQAANTTAELNRTQKAIAGATPGIAPGYNSFQPVTDMDRRIFNAIERPLRDFGDRFARSISRENIQNRIRANARLRNALREFAYVRGYENPYILSTLEGMIQRGKRFGA